MTASKPAASASTAMRTRARRSRGGVSVQFSDSTSTSRGGIPRSMTGRMRSGPSSVELDELLGDVEQIAGRTVMGDIEDRCLGIGVDRDDRSGRLHAGEVLNRAGDAEGEVDLRFHRLARLADLA